MDFVKIISLTRKMMMMWNSKEDHSIAVCEFCHRKKETKLCSLFQNNLKLNILVKRFKALLSGEKALHCLTFGVKL